MATQKTRTKPPRLNWRPNFVPLQKGLYIATDHGHPITLDPSQFIPVQRDQGWGSFAENFIRGNETALRALGAELILSANKNGPILQLRPGSRAGAIPLKSSHTGKVCSGFIVKPRFGWAGVGHILSKTGWHAAPQFLPLPAVPGSGREIPPWVIAGPVLSRLAQLLNSIKRGYRLKQEDLGMPRGRILWNSYLKESVVKGRWHRLPCQYPDLGSDPELRSYIRWALESIKKELLRVGARDLIALSLALLSQGLIEKLLDVNPHCPTATRLHRMLGSGGLTTEIHRHGIEALSWVVDERGMGGGQEQDGLSWQIPLEELWENYVESIVREEARNVGATVKVGRLNETVFPLYWSDVTHRSLGHLVPDFVVSRGDHIKIVDAKYKAHLVDLDETGWRQFTEDAKQAHRADIHQVLAYASLFDASSIEAVLMYPLRFETWNELKATGKDRSVAELNAGGRRLRVELRGVAFGAA